MTTQSTPLISLDVVVIDTETTGLDAKSSRLLQVGAIRVQGTHVELEGCYESLVNPGVSIPPESTRIHGITDNDVATAPDPKTILAELENYVADAAIVGHTIDFDLDILRNEAELNGANWPQRRTLDIRQLAQLTGSPLADYSLDGLCEWQGIEIHNRHSARGDAEATAQVYARLLPLLRAAGIRTLAEADAASRRLFEKSLTGAGDLSIHRVTDSNVGEIRSLSRIDSFPYRHRVRDVMSAPPIIVSPEMTLGDALSLVLEKDISSVFVKSGGEEPRGIVTERDVLRAIHREGGAVLETPLRSVMQTPLQSISEEAFVYRAIGRMDRLGFRHLGVHNNDGDIVGAITTRNLLRHRASTAMMLGDEINAANDVAALGKAWAQLPLMAKQLLDEDVDSRNAAAVISSEICMLTRRAAQLAEEQMIADGKGKPPVPYAVLVMGSAGRGESLLAADQDNAIVFQSGEPGGPEDQWLEALGVKMTDILDEVGVPYCQGGVMARNAEWRQSVSGWKETIDTWVRRQKPEDLLNVDIFFDAIPVHGDLALGETVWSYAYDRGAETPAFIRMLSEHIRYWRPPLSMFGNLRLKDNGRIDLKKNGLFPIVTAARI
ncbi:MAG: DUF294 nucleotidyltransferase-like domain-containing protein, partial [Hyphomicrobiaceae bacterium]